MNPGLSPLAQLVGHPRDVEDRSRDGFGVALHTMGRGIAKLARRLGVTPIEAAISFYSTHGNNFPNYAVGHAGMEETYQIANEKERAWHIGRFVDVIVDGKKVKVDRRAQYISGEWRKVASPAVVAAWDAQWGARYKHPYQLFPGTSPNDAYYGIELLPITDDEAEPAAPGHLFTAAQYAAAGELVVDIAMRNKWPNDWWETSRLVGHECVSPLDRFDKEGGWDPGCLRKNPYFDRRLLINGFIIPAWLKRRLRSISTR